MPPRIAWYALGGGLGHLNRALAVLRHLRPLVPDAGVLLLTSAAYPHLAMSAGVPVMRVPGAAEAAQFPKGAVGALVAAILERLAPLDLLVVDTFADGLHLELTPAVLGLAARRALVWREGGVDPEGSPAWPHYDAVIAPTPTSARADARPVGWVLTRRPDEALTRADARRALGLPAAADRPLVLGMHAGEPGEVMGFFEHVMAGAARLDRPHDLRLATPLPLPGPEWAGRPELVYPYPAAEVLPAADLLVCGAGYNSAAEAAAFGVRTLFRPFARSHDDQATRATGHVFGAFDAPAVVAAAIAAALDAPAPAPADPATTDGARTAARLLVDLLRS